MNTASELLEAAAHVALIARTTNAYARTESGHTVPVSERSACMWCAVGLLDSAAELAPKARREELFNEAYDRVSDMLSISIEKWNDFAADDLDVYYLFMEAAACDTDTLS